MLSANLKPKSPENTTITYCRPTNQPHREEETRNTYSRMTLKTLTVAATSSLFPSGMIAKLELIPSTA